MNLREAKEYVKKISLVLVEHIREKYHPDFTAPEIEFDNRWMIIHNSWGEYSFTKGRIRITRNSRICQASLADTLAHEFGHALLDQINPEFGSVGFLRDGDYLSLTEGIAKVFGEEGLKILKKQGLYHSYSILDSLKIKLNVYLNPIYWWHKLNRRSLPYDQGKKSTEELRKGGMSLEDIMKQAHKPEFAHSIPYSCETKLGANNKVRGHKKKNRDK